MIVHGRWVISNLVTFNNHNLTQKMIPLYIQSYNYYWWIKCWRFHPIIINHQSLLLANISSCMVVVLHVYLYYICTYVPSPSLVVSFISLFGSSISLHCFLNISIANNLSFIASRVFLATCKIADT